MDNTEIEDYFQKSLNHFDRRKKEVPITIAKLSKALNETEQEYKEALVNGTKYIIKEYERILNQDKYKLENYKDISQLLREPQREDIEYRIRQFEEFPSQIAKKIADDKMLCFHGTTIVGAKNIMRTGEISSGADRFGRSTSFDPPGKISVTNKDTIDTSVRQYMRLIDDFCYPAGCIFVISAKNKEEYQNLSSGWMIDNVSFKNEPERLVAVISTPENMGRLKQWENEGGIDTSKIMDFDSFIRNNEKTHTQTNVLNTVKDKKMRE